MKEFIPTVSIICESWRITEANLRLSKRYKKDVGKKAQWAKICNWFNEKTCENRCIAVERWDSIKFEILKQVLMNGFRRLHEIANHFVPLTLASLRAHNEKPYIETKRELDELKKIAKQSREESKDFPFVFREMVLLKQIELTYESKDFPIVRLTEAGADKFFEYCEAMFPDGARRFIWHVAIQKRCALKGIYWEWINKTGWIQVDHPVEFVID